MDKKQIQKEKDKEKAKIQLDTEIKAFSKSLSNKDQRVVIDTKKLVEDQSNGLIKGETTNLQLVYATHAGAMINCLGTSTVTLPTSATVGDTYELLTSSAAGTYLTVLAGTNIMINGHTNAGGNSEAKIHHTGSSLVVTCIKASSPLTYVVGTLMAVPFADES